MRVLAGGERERSHRAALEAAEKADEPRPARDITGELDRCFDGFGAALAAEDLHRLAHRVELVDLLGKTRHALMPVIARDVQEIIRRVLYGLHHLRVRVASTADGNARGKIEVTVTVYVPYFDPATLGHYERVVAHERWRADEPVALEQCLRSRPR